MFRRYWDQLKAIYTQPGPFFERVLDKGSFAQALRFAAGTGALIALELGVSEALTSSSPAIVALVTLVALAAIPLGLLLWVYLWSAFMRLCAFLLQEDLPWASLRLVVGYSAAGFCFLGLGDWFGKLLGLATVYFQVLGVERMLKSSRWTAVLFVSLPFSIFLVLLVFFSLMFKVF